MAVCGGPDSNGSPLGAAARSMNTADRDAASIIRYAEEEFGILFGPKGIEVDGPAKPKRKAVADFADSIVSIGSHVLSGDESSEEETATAPYFVGSPSVRTLSPSVTKKQASTAMEELCFGSFSQPAPLLDGFGDVHTPDRSFSQEFPPPPPGRLRLKQAARRGKMKVPGAPCKAGPRKIWIPEEEKFNLPPLGPAVVVPESPWVQEESDDSFSGYFEPLTGSNTAAWSEWAQSFGLPDDLDAFLEHNPAKTLRPPKKRPRLQRPAIVHRPVTRSQSTIQKVFVSVDHFEDQSRLQRSHPSAEYVVGRLVRDYICPHLNLRMIEVKVPGYDEPLELMHGLVDIFPPQPLLPEIQYAEGCVCCLPAGEEHLPAHTDSDDEDFTSDNDPIPATWAEKMVEEDKVWDNMLETESDMLRNADEFFRYDKALPFHQRFHDIHWLREGQQGFGTDRSWHGAEEIGVPTLSRSSTPLQILESFITSSMWTRLVRQTNLYAKQKQRKGWVKLTVLEFKCWLGICVFMGINRLPRLSMHWRTDHPIFNNSFISGLMTRDRWLAIRSCVHLVDNNSYISDKQDVRYDKIGKVRWFLDALCANFRMVKPVDRYVSVDEMMVLCTSSYCPIKQYHKDKPISHGVKVWALVSSLSKYIYALDVYCGVHSGTAQASSSEMSANISTEHRPTYKVVMALLKHVPSHVGHVATMDNYFSSVQLFSDLLDRRIFATGTVRPNVAGWPSSMPWSKKLKGERGSILSRMHVSQEIGACVWFDRRAVGVLSTFAVPCSDNTFVVRKEGREKISLTTSASVVSYVKFMRGVDIADQLRGPYSVSRKSRRWWKCILYFSFDSAFCNSWVVAQQLWEDTDREEKPWPTHLDFNIALGDSLVAGWKLANSGRKSTVSGKVFRAHAPVHLRLRRKCAICGRRSSWQCEVCKETPFLCLSGSPSCYQRFHETKRRYV